MDVGTTKNTLNSLLIQMHLVHQPTYPADVDSKPRSGIVADPLEPKKMARNVQLLVQTLLLHLTS